MKIFKGFGKRIALIAFAVYVIYTLYSQQLTLNTYQADADRYQGQIASEQETKEELTSIKENINSDEYIEDMAREKLGMYLPNERVYIDITK